MAAASKTRDQRRDVRPLSRIERKRILDALRFARCEPAAMRPLLNEAEAACLDMFRRLRADRAGANPTTSRLAEYLGWTRSATLERLEALRRKGFIARAADCSLYMETVESVAFTQAAPLVALCLSLAALDPRDQSQWQRAVSIHHANAVHIARELAQLAATTESKVSTRTARSTSFGPAIPIVLWRGESTRQLNGSDSQIGSRDRPVVRPQVSSDLDSLAIREPVEQSSAA